MSCNNYYVYGLFRPDNGRIFYVGMGKGQRAWRHVSQRKFVKSYKNNVICKLIDETGYKDIPVVIIRDGLTQKDAADLEIVLIYAIGRYPHGPLTNATAGGEGVRDLSPEIRERIAAPQRGRPKSAEAKVKMSLAKKGRTLPEATRVKLSAAGKGKTHSEKARAKMRTAWEGKTWITDGVSIRQANKSAIPEGWWKGRGGSYSEETRAKISIANTGKHPTIETRCLMSEKAKARDRTGEWEQRRKKAASSLEAIAKRRAAMKGRVWITNGIIMRRVEKSSIPDGWRRGRL